MASSNIIKAIQSYVDSAIDKAGFDKTRTGIVLSRNVNNTYTIKVDGIEYQGVKCIGEALLSSGTIVKVHIPNNQPSQMYINSTGQNLESILIYIDSTNGNTFYNTAINTILKPQITYNDEIIESQAQLISAFGNGAILKWFDEDENELSVTDPFNFTVALADTIDRVKYVAKLVVDGSNIKAQQYVVLGKLDNGTSLTIASQSITYAVSNDGKNHPSATSSDWKSDIPTINNGQYLWIKTTITYSDTTSMTSYSVAYKGTNGVDGSSSYTHIRYADNSDGNDFTDTPTSATKYIGVCVTTSSTAPTSKEDYKPWMQYIGSDGDNGNGITSISYFYKTTSTDTVPSASSITSATIPEMDDTNNKYLWCKQIINFTDTTVADKVTVMLQAVYGDTGENGSSAVWYTGTAITGTSTTPTSYSTSIAQANIGDMYLNTSTQYVYRCTVSGDASTAKWIYVTTIKGATGAAVTSVKSQYYLSTSNTTQTGGSWVDSLPTYVSGRYYWERVYVSYDTGTSTTSTPVLSNGITSANSNASNAVATANTANTNATNALTTAKDAASTANTANTNATNALNKTTLYATSTTKASEAAKEASLIGGTLTTSTLTKGTSVAVTFTYANTSSSPTLNIASMGAKPIMTNGVLAGYWSEGATVLFTYDDSYWQVASTPVYASVVNVGNTAEEHIRIESNSVKINNGSRTDAEFGVYSDWFSEVLVYESTSGTTYTFISRYQFSSINSITAYIEYDDDEGYTYTDIVEANGISSSSGDLLDYNDEVKATYNINLSTKTIDIDISNSGSDKNLTYIEIEGQATNIATLVMNGDKVSLSEEPIDIFPTLIDFVPYVDEQQLPPPKFSVRGDVANIYGVISPKATISANGVKTICKIPTKYCPHVSISELCVGEGTGNSATGRFRTWICTVDAEGYVKLSLYRAYTLSSSTNGATSAATTAKLPFNITWII